MPLTDNETEILTHLGYEWWMARSTHNILLDMIPIADPVRNAMIESMNIHIRALISFFCTEPKNKPDPKKIDDWFVYDLNHNLTYEKMSDEVRDVIVDINKRVAHLTNRRTDMVHEWHVEQVLKFIERKILEVRTALGTDFPMKWNGDASATTIMLSSVNSETVVGASAQPMGGIGATGPAPPGY